MSIDQQADFQNRLASMLAASPCLPVLAISDTADAQPLAEALQAGGIHNIEVTLRTPNALEVVKVIAGIKGMTVGVGTVFNAEQVSQSKAAGASYVVSPGFNETVFQACLANDIPYLPGVVTPTEMQTVQEKGFKHLKFFPAEASGGVPMLKAIAPVFQDLKFCATGGITMENMKSYLNLPNVVAVGMSAMVPAEVFKSKDWAKVTDQLKQVGLDKSLDKSP
jgi:2-dehydro-3-deoxyphosphogluconate aldolase / (4S)-4-hydroxy-2-oxoglutarate aldolase